MIILQDRIYIDSKFDVEAAEKHYTKFMINYKACKGCPFVEDRPCSACETCERGAVTEIIKTYTTKRFKGREYYGFPMGDRDRLEDIIDCDYGEHKIKDLRNKAPFDYPIKFTGKLRDYQEPAFEDWLDSGTGLLEAPPRSGKTITSIAIAVELGQKTIILASQEDFLRGFISACKTVTNLPELEEKHGKKLYGIIKKESDYDKYQICVCTYQKFIHDYKRVAKYINKNFGLVWVDEVHKAAASCFSSVMMRVATRYRGGCSATIRRKDTKEWLVYQALGSVTARCVIESMKPKMYVHPTYIKPPKSQYGNTPGAWVYAMKFLMKQEERKRMIIEQAVLDVKKGHSVVIPLIHVEQIKDYVRAINNVFEDRVAEMFVGSQTKDKRESILEECKSGAVKVLVGTRQLLQLGLNVPRWSALYYVIPMNNEPNWAQESARILTPPDASAPDKKDPIIRMFVDEGMKQSENCFAQTMNYSIKNGYKLPPSTIRRIQILDLTQTRHEIEINSDPNKGTEFNDSKWNVPADGGLFG